MQKLEEILLSLCKISAVSGDERNAASLVQRLKNSADTVKMLAGGSILACKRSGVPGAKKILIDAHLDQIGLMVKSIDDNGFIHFINHVGVDEKVLPCSEVTIMTKDGDLAGVVAAKPPHLLTKEERKKPLKMEDMVIDTGLSPQEVKSRVRVGDKIALRGDFGTMLNSLVTGRSLDNRACCAVLVSFFEQIKDRRLPVDVYGVFSSGEEFSGYGVVSAVNEIRPDEAIVLDVSHGDMPAARSEDCGELGKGVMIGVSPILNRKLISRLIAAAKGGSIPFQPEAMSGLTYTNCDSVVSLCGGIPTALLSVPLRYMHTPQEVVSLEDMAALRALLTAYIGKEGAR